MISIQITRNAGLFSVLSSVFSQLPLVPDDEQVHIYFRSILYSNPGENMFDWFFDQPPLQFPCEIWRFGADGDAPGHAATDDCIIKEIREHNPDLYEGNSHLGYYHDRLLRFKLLVMKYLRPKPEYLAIARNIIGDHKTFGIHYRGTDKKIEVARVPPEKVYELFVQRHQGEAVFLATDEQSAAEYFQARIPNLILNPHLRCNSDLGLHATHGCRQQAIEAMIDVYCLAMCESLLIGRGNVGDMALIFGDAKSVEYFN